MNREKVFSAFEEFGIAYENWQTRDMDLSLAKAAEAEAHKRFQIAVIACEKLSEEAFLVY